MIDIRDIFQKGAPLPPSFYEIPSGTYVLVDGNEAYIERVYAEACKAERRPADSPSFYFGLRVDGRAYVRNPVSSFERVGRRIQYRLDNNSWIERIVVVDGKIQGESR